MGMNYHIACKNCTKNSSEVEFSIVNHYSLKHPDEAEQYLYEWVEFLVEHSGHELAFLDSRDNPTHPDKITGQYVLFGVD